MSKESKHPRHERSGGEFDRFSDLLRRLLQVPKYEIKKAEAKRLKHRPA